MVAKFAWYYLLLISLVYVVSSRAVPFPPGQENHLTLSTTSAPAMLHLNIHERSYSAQEKYQYIQDCVEKCLQMKSNRLGSGRDTCIQTQCRFTQWSRLALKRIREWRWTSVCNNDNKRIRPSVLSLATIWCKKTSVASSIARERLVREAISIARNLLLLHAVIGQKRTTTEINN